MNRTALTDRMEKCAQAAQENAEAAAKLAKQAGEEAGRPAPQTIEDDRTITVRNLDVAAGMHNAAAAMLIQCVGTYAAMRGEVKQGPETGVDRRLAQADGADDGDKVQERAVAS